jgi:hypothetical protein
MAAMASGKKAEPDKPSPYGYQEGGYQGGAAAARLSKGDP